MNTEELLRQLVSLSDYNPKINREALVKEVLDQLGNGNYQIKIVPYAKPEIVKMIRDAGITIEFGRFDNLVLISWEAIAHVAINLSSELKIGLDEFSACLFDYCQLSRIGFTLDRHWEYGGHQILLPEEIELLNDDNKKILPQHITTCHLTYPSEEIKHLPFLIKLSIFIAVWLKRDGRLLFDELRGSPDFEDLLTNSWFNWMWKKLSTQEILDKRFNPEHLHSLGIKLPTIDDILEMENVNIENLKILLNIREDSPYYSDPSDSCIQDILNMLIGGLIPHHHIIIMLVRYRRNIMIHYQDHPFVNHLLQISSTKMKSSNTK